MQKVSATAAGQTIPVGIHLHLHSSVVILSNNRGGIGSPSLVQCACKLSAATSNEGGLSIVHTSGNTTSRDDDVTVLYLGVQKKRSQTRAQAVGTLFSYPCGPEYWIEAGRDRRNSWGKKQQQQGKKRRRRRMQLFRRASSIQLDSRSLFHSH